MHARNPSIRLLPIGKPALAGPDIAQIGNLRAREIEEAEVPEIVSPGLFAPPSGGSFPPRAGLACSPEINDFPVALWSARSNEIINVLQRRGFSCAPVFSAASTLGLEAYSNS